MRNQQSMTVEVNKERLLTTLRDNRKEHREQFLAAQEVYRTRVIEQLDQRLKAIRDGDPINLYFQLPEPRDYTDDYDTVIEMIEWHEGDKFELEHMDFERFVLNKWQWASEFAASTQAYLVE